MQQVTAAILMKDKKIFIAKRPANDQLPHKWEFPGGKIEAGETPGECLKREMREEFGIDVRVGDYFCSSVYHYSHAEIELLAYFVDWVGGMMAPMAHAGIRWVMAQELSKFDFAPADVAIVERLQEKIW
jgi:8-oxo-dGTP diphosphatase